MSSESNHSEQVSNTLYINRINDNVSINQLILHVFAYFSPYGQILDISASKAIKKRGQAWVTYQNIESAINAKRDLNGIYIFSTPINIQFAKKRNVNTLKLNGTYNPYGRPKEKIQDAEIRKLTTGPIPYHWDIDMGGNEESITELVKPIVQKITEEPAEETPKITLQAPNKILFIQNIPVDTDKQVLDFLFGQMPGFVELRTSPGLKTIAFAEYENEDNAAVAMRELNGFEIEDHRLTIQFSK